MDFETVNEAISEALMWLEKAQDPYKAPEARADFVNKAVNELKSVYTIAVEPIEDEDDNEDDLLDGFIVDDSDEEDEDEDEYEDDDDDDEDDEDEEDEEDEEK